jgi:hypothetical protein
LLETWSNLNLADREAHAERGSTSGWLVTSRADLLMVYFLDSDDLVTVTVPLSRLKRWAFGSGPQGGIYAWPEKPQGRYGQANDMGQVRAGGAPGAVRRGAADAGAAVEPLAGKWSGELARKGRLTDRTIGNRHTWC